MSFCTSASEFLGKKRRFAFWSCLGVTSICTVLASPVSGPVRHVLHISADGLGGVHLKQYLAEAPEDFPALTRVAAEGAGTFNARCDYHISLTEPNHASIFTGRPVSQQPVWATLSAPHGFTANYDPGPLWTLHNFGNRSVPYKASVFDVVHDHGGATAFFAGKQKFDLFVRSYDAEHGAPDRIEPDDGPGKMDCHAIIDWFGPDMVQQNDSNLVNLVIETMTTNLPAYTFLHLAGPDIAGHYHLWGSEEYRESVRELDRHLTRLTAAIEASPALSNHTAIVLTSDHGGGDAAGSHIYPNALPVFTIPMLLWGPGVPAGFDLYALFANRTDPGTQYLDYNAPLQPLRNGDSGNIALALLGLPPIPGSCLIPEMKPKLFLSRQSEGLALSWAATSVICDLQYSEVCSGVNWTTITEDITVQDGWNVYVVTPSAETPMRFYRLMPAASP
jgi:hypothetical protein